MIMRISFLVRLALAASLIAMALLSAAQAQKPQVESAQSPSAAPNVQIAQVRNLGIQGDDATLVIEVNWTATAPQATHIKRFTITVVSEFTAPSTTPFSITQEFDLSKGNAFDGHNSSSPQSRGQFLNIAEVKKLVLGCAPNENCFEVSWGVASNVPGIAAVSRFNLEAEFTYKFGQSAGVIRNQSDNADGSKHQATLKVTDVPSGTGDLSIHVKATVKAFVTVATTKTFVKDGSF